MISDSDAFSALVLSVSVRKSVQCVKNCVMSCWCCHLFEVQMICMWSIVTPVFDGLSVSCIYSVLVQCSNGDNTTGFGGNGNEDLALLH